MPVRVADPPDARCSSPFPEAGIAENQWLDPDRFSPRARDARGRFAKGHSGNPRGRPPGIPNPRQGIPDLRARPLSPERLSALLDRKPHLLRPLAAQLLPPVVAMDPAERLGIDLAKSATPDGARQALVDVWSALSRGEIAPSEAAQIARRVRRRLRLARRLARLRRRLAQKTGPLPTALT